MRTEIFGFLRGTGQLAPYTPSTTDTDSDDTETLIATPPPATLALPPGTTAVAAMDIIPPAALPPPPAINKVLATAGSNLLEAALYKASPDRDEQMGLYLDALRYLARALPRDDPASAALAAELREIITGEETAVAGRARPAPLGHAPRAATVPYRASRAMVRGVRQSVRTMAWAAATLDERLRLRQRAARWLVRGGAAGCYLSAAAAGTAFRVGDHWVGEPMRRLAAWLLEDMAAGLRDGMRESGWKT